MLMRNNLFLIQVFLLTSLAALIASSTLLNEYERQRPLPDPIQSKYKYYSNKKGTQVIEISPDNVCHIFYGDDARWLREHKKERMTELHYIKFRLMIGKCQIDALLFNKRNTYTRIQSKEDKININTNSFNENVTMGITSALSQELENIPVNSHEFTKNPNMSNHSEDFETTTPTPPVKVEGTRLPLIFPGTKWCGSGSVARSNDDLGYYLETDKCCRDHDNCEDNMEGKQCKYGLCNDSEFTRSHCDCDDKFRNCLQKDKSGSSLASFKIGNLYFNILKPLCFAARPPVKWCNRYRITGECVDFEFDMEYPEQYQFFPSQPYHSGAVQKWIQPALSQIPSPMIVIKSPTTQPEVAAPGIGEVEVVEAEWKKNISEKDIISQTDSPIPVKEE